MYQFKLYNVTEIENLKQKLEDYEQKRIPISSYKKSNKFPELHQALKESKEKNIQLKGELKRMETQYEEQINRYEQQAQHIITKLESIDDSINQLKQDISLIKGEVNSFHLQEVIGKLDQVIEKTDDNLAKIKNDIELQNQDFSQIRERLTPKEEPKSVSAQSEYRRVQNILHSITTSKGALIQSNKTTRKKPAQSKNPSINRIPTRPNSRNNTLSISQSRKSFVNSQYELNKNIIKKKNTPSPVQEPITKEETQKIITPEPISTNKVVNTDSLPATPIENKSEPKVPEVSKMENEALANPTESKAINATQQVMSHDKTKESPNHPKEQTEINATSKRSSFFSFFKSK